MTWNPCEGATETPGGPAGGDLGGTYPNPDVEAIDGVVLSGVPPTAGQILTATGAAAAGWAAPGASAVTSVFTRSGAVVAVAGDYFGVVAAALTGVTSGTTRFVGSLTVGAAPVSGTFAVGDFTVNDDGSIWVCTVAGTPGTWVNAATVLANGSLAVAKLVAGLAGQVLGGTGPSYAYPPGFEIGYDQITSTVNVASTTEGTPTTIIAGTSRVYENVPYLFHFFTPHIDPPTVAGAQVTLLLIQDASSIGRIGLAQNPVVTQQALFPCVAELRFTPSAGAHTFGIAAFATSLTGTPDIAAGAGGAATTAPAFLRVTKC